MDSRIISSFIHIWEDQLMMTIQLLKSSQYWVKEIVNHREVNVSFQTWICSLLKEINKQTQYAVVFSSPPPFVFIAAEPPETSLQTERKTSMAKVDFVLSLGKSTQIGSQDFYHENIRIVIWILRLQTQPFCSSHGWMLPLHSKLALVSLCWLLELIFRTDNSPLSAEALNTDCKDTSIRHRGIAGILFYIDAWMSRTGSGNIILDVERNDAWLGGD